ncbi:FxsA family protein [Paenibacillus sp. HJGM_3]
MILFIVVPALEIWALFEVGKLIGGWQTFALLLLSGFAGAYLAKREGLKVWANAQRQLSAGQMPAQSILDGICIFAGGLMMMAPGFLSDVLGLLLVFPLTRPIFRQALNAWLRRKLANGGTFRFYRW